MNQWWSELLYYVYIDAVHNANFKSPHQYYNNYDYNNIIDIKLRMDLELFAHDNKYSGSH